MNSEDKAPSLNNSEVKSLSELRGGGGTKPTYRSVNLFVCSQGHFISFCMKSKYNCISARLAFRLEVRAQTPLDTFSWNVLQSGHLSNRRRKSSNELQVTFNVLTSNAALCVMCTAGKPEIINFLLL